MRALALVLIALATSAAALARTQPIVRAEVNPESVIVGESAELTITVLVPTWFTRPPVYPSFELANAMTRLPADSSFSLRERVGNESWSGIVRTYEIYPLLGASYRTAGQTITVTFANPGSDPTSVEVDVPELVLRGVVPEGAESLDPYLAGRELTLGLDVEGRPDELQTGDAIVLTYRAELEGLPAIFLPPLAPDLEFAGVSIYRDLPKVQDAETAVRTEKITLVFDAGGEFHVPGIDLRYWNTASQSIEAATAQGLLLSVQGAPATAAAEEGPAGIAWRAIAAWVAGATAMLLVLWRGLPELARRSRDAAQQRRQTEEYAFRQLVRNMRSGNEPAAYRALLRWTMRLEPGMDASTFAARHGDDNLSVAVTALSEAVHGDGGTAFNATQLRSQLRAARKRYLARDSSQDGLRLPPLNP